MSQSYLPYQITSPNPSSACPGAPGGIFIGLFVPQDIIDELEGLQIAIEYLNNEGSLSTFTATLGGYGIIGNNAQYGGAESTGTGTVFVWGFFEINDWGGGGGLGVVLQGANGEKLTISGLPEGTGVCANLEGEQWVIYLSIIGNIADPGNQSSLQINTFIGTPYSQTFDISQFLSSTSSNSSSTTSSSSGTQTTTSQTTNSNTTSTTNNTSSSNTTNNTSGSYTQLEQEIQQLEQEISSLESEQSQLENEVNNISSGTSQQISELENELQQLENEQSTIENEIEQLQASGQGTSQQVQQLEQEEEQIQQEEQQVQQQLQQLQYSSQQQNQQLVNELQQLEQEQQNLASEIAQLQSSGQGTSQQVQQLQQELEQVQQAISSLSQSVSTSQQGVSQSNQQIEQMLQQIQQQEQQIQEQINQIENPPSIQQLLEQGDFSDALKYYPQYQEQIQELMQVPGSTLDSKVQFLESQFYQYAKQAYDALFSGDNGLAIQYKKQAKQILSLLNWLSQVTGQDYTSSPYVQSGMKKLKAVINVVGDTMKYAMPGVLGLYETSRALPSSY